jgi:large subunit ribosomal protein L30
VPRKKKAAEATGQLRIEQIRSSSGRPGNHRDTLRALGLRHHQHVVVQKDSPSIRGMIFRVRHLVRVEEIPGGSS